MKMSVLEDNNETSGESNTEEAAVVIDSATNSAANDPSVQNSPRIEATELLEATALQDAVNLLRRFHLGEPSAVASTEVPDKTCLPILMNNFRDVRRFRYEYPLLLSPGTNGELIAKPLDEFLKDAMPDGDSSAKILKDNLAWLETYIRDQVSGQDFATPARDLIVEASAALQKQFDLNDASKETLQADLDQLKESTPLGSYLLPYGPNIALHLLQHSMRQHAQWQHEQLARRIENSVRGLQQLVTIEAKKTSNGEIKVGEAKYFDDPSLADALKHRGQGSVLMEKSRLKRIKSTLKSLKAFKIDEHIIHLVIRQGSFSIKDSGSLNIVKAADPCAKAMAIYDSTADRLSKLFASLRTAEIEIAGDYDARFHDSWFASFDVEAFSEEEKQMIPAVVAFESAEKIAVQRMQSFSTVLASGKPIQILVYTDPHTNPGQTEDLLGGLRVELAYLGIGHRHAIINQASASKVESLLDGFSAAHTSHKTCLHLIHNGFSEPQLLHPWIMASAALESRAQPFIRYDPGTTANTAELAFAGNPCPRDDWATNLTSYTNEQGELVEEKFTFTFADYCLLKPELREHFRLVPDGCVSDDLVKVEDYLNASADIRDRQVPFVWSVNADGLMQKLAISRRLAFACRDRLEFWHSLQSLAGVKNIYVEEAVKVSREEEQQQATAEREGLIKEHEEALQQVQSESEAEVMARLTNVLIGLDLGSDTLLAPAPGMTESKTAEAPSAEPKTGEAVVEETVEEKVEEAEDEEDDVSFNDPWIDSPFCTTCDDCMTINKQVFVYNDDRQAIITDATLGTYAQMVEAAELCPAKCIHPGQPLDSSEPNLEELIQRAAAFN